MREYYCSICNTSEKRKIDDRCSCCGSTREERIKDGRVKYAELLVGTMVKEAQAKAKELEKRLELEIDFEYSLTIA